MIQKTSQRQLNAVLAGKARPSTYSTSTSASLSSTQSDGGPEEWGQWVRDRHYSLEVTQHPIRARMCGFGDKDRRPLAPAAVAKMIVRREDNSIVDVDDIDVDFFVVTVDLWSADGKEEMNLVLHPSSADRYLPAHIVKPRKPRGITIPEKPGHATPPTTSSLRPTRPSPYPTPSERPLRQATGTGPGPGSGGFTLRPIDPTPPLLTTTSTYNSYFGNTSSDPWSAASEPSTPWAFNPQPSLDRANSFPTLPSIHSLQRSSPTSALTDLSAYDTSELGFRGWNDLFDAAPQDPTTTTTAAATTTTTTATSSGRPWPNNEAFTLPAIPTLDGWNPPAPQSIPDPLPQPPTPQETPTVPSNGSNTQHAYQPFSQSPSSVPSSLSLPRHTYTRTLVGPLCANAQRLQDEHRKPGIFFLFQDLSIRTEGTFRLRMRLMNVGELPAPNARSNSVNTGVSPVLAQVFTEPFTVYSAKRFPGVPDTTALSIAFGNQGQKLPLRNRHGTGKPRRARNGRGGDDDSDDDSS